MRYGHSWPVHSPDFTDSAVFHEAAFVNGVLLLPTTEISGPLKNRVINRAVSGQRDTLMPSGTQNSGASMLALQMEKDNFGLSWR